MSRLFNAAIAVLAIASAGAADAQPTTTLTGVWRLDDGSATVRVEPCTNTANWCATVIEEQLEPGEESSLNQMVVQDMRPNGKNRWSGRYIAGGQSMKATAKLTRPDALSFKVCAMGILCDTMRLSLVSN